MITPGVYHIKLQRRADYSVLLQFKDSNQAAIDLTGWEVHAQAWDLGRSTKYVTFNTEYIDRHNGTVKLKLTHTQTASLPNELVYDVLLINPSGLREFYLEGSIQVMQGYTEVEAEQ